MGPRSPHSSLPRVCTSATRFQPHLPFHGICGGGGPKFSWASAVPQTLPVSSGSQQQFTSSGIVLRPRQPDGGRDGRTDGRTVHCPLSTTFLFLFISSRFIFPAAAGLMNSNITPPPCQHPPLCCSDLIPFFFVSSEDGILVGLEALRHHRGGADDYGDDCRYF